jgi:nitroreductase
VNDLLAAAMAAPSACAKDPWRFVVVRNRETLNQMADALPNGKAMLEQAPVGIAVCGDLRAAHAGELSYLLQDCSAAIENLLLAAHTLGLGACWLGVHPRPPRIEALTRILRLPEKIIPVSCIAVGWPDETQPARTRFKRAYVHDETW